MNLKEYEEVKNLDYFAYFVNKLRKTIIYSYTLFS